MAISEIQRVSKKYIIITVPNSEDIEHSLVSCPICHCCFNPHFHLRDFNEDKLKHLFNKFEAITIKSIGPVFKYRIYNRFLLSLYSAFKRPSPSETSICPQCGYGYIKENIIIKNYFNFYKFFINIVKIFFPIKEKKRWLVGLYNRKGL